MNRASFVRRKLFTREDPYHVHKTLGALAVLSFVYRYMVVFARGGAHATLGFSGTWFDVATMAVHAALSVSGMIFRVPSRRMRKLPTTIYEEYRQHAALFTLRSASMFALAVLAPRAVAQHRAVRYALLFAWHVQVDRVTARWGTAGQTAVRGADRTSRWEVWLLRRFYALYQFAALASNLVYHDDGAALAFNTIIAIQSSAFLMTLHRKGLVKWQTHATVYSLCLFASYYYIYYQLGSPRFVAAVLLAFAARSYFGVNKYLVWLPFAAFV
mmetsp:Transcript_55102/g.135148  ORF Transcript_55102/g.135148 Transcript_55102/m.135148 type:complete len:271 (-) Transcript_55102:87-899(-)